MDIQESCLMFLVMKWRPEKRTPWYADYPQYYDENGHGVGFTPGSFRPDEDWNHLYMVADKLKVKLSGNNIKANYRKVINVAYYIFGKHMDYVKELHKNHTRQSLPKF